MDIYKYCLTFFKYYSYRGKKLNDKDEENTKIKLENANLKNELANIKTTLNEILNATKRHIP